MNEEAIAQKLADALPKEEPIKSGYPDQEQPTGTHVDQMLPEELFTAGRLMDYLQVPTAMRHDPMVADYVQTVYQWARDNAGTGDFVHLIRVISEQEQHMGSKLKPDRLRRLAEYVKISRVRAQLAAREMELYG